MSAIRKYFQHYAEPETNTLATFPDTQHYQHCVVIPAYDEDLDFIARLDQTDGLLIKNNALAIIIINQPDTQLSCEKNDALWRHIQQTMQPLWSQNNLHLMQSDTGDHLIIDRFQSNRIPVKQGVGLARKIGSDVAAYLINKKICVSPWIHSTDADAYLPSDYFCSSSEFESQYSAFIYGFHHHSNDSNISKATQLYETSLRYYVSGLEWARSPYAFHTIGSLLAVHYNYYCQCRGFPKRSGGEDFYLLNKLSKLGFIGQTNTTVFLEPRLSHRVPFGTGPAVEKIISQPKIIKLDYHPDVFNLLKEFIETAEHIINSNQDFDQINQQTSEVILAALHSLGIKKLIAHLKQTNTNEQKINHFHDWFDAFRTLKFIHYLRDNHFPSIDLAHAIEQAPFTTVTYAKRT
jgi:hypothetical protein